MEQTPVPPVSAPPVSPEPAAHEPAHSQNQSHPAARMTAGIIVLSLLFGLAGGVLGNYFSSKTWQGKSVPAATAPEAGTFTPQPVVTVPNDDEIINVVKKASPAVVSIVSTSVIQSQNPYGDNPFFPFYGYPGINTPQKQVTSGSGFFVSADGLIVTNKHVVSDANASYTVTLNDGKQYDAKVMSRDPINDLAIIKIDIQDAPFLTFANSDQLQIGQHVVVIGNSLGQYQNTVTSGIISGINRNITAGDGDTSEQLSGVLQTDAAINPGNSGGPLLNLASQVVGISTAIDQQGQLVGFAIPSNDVARDLQSYQKFGQITRPFLGVRYVLIDQDIADQEKLSVNYGALIVKGNTAAEPAITPGSPADKAGLQENDIILEVGGTKVDAANTLSQLLKDTQPGQTVTLKVLHAGSTRDVAVTLDTAK